MISMISYIIGNISSSYMTIIFKKQAKWMKRKLCLDNKFQAIS